MQRFVQLLLCYHEQVHPQVKYDLVIIVLEMNKVLFALTLVVKEKDQIILKIV